MKTQTEATPRLSLSTMFEKLTSHLSRLDSGMEKRTNHR
jgi:hypothetical protein